MPRMTPPVLSVARDTIKVRRGKLPAMPVLLARTWKVLIRLRPLPRDVCHVKRLNTQAVQAHQVTMRQPVAIATAIVDTSVSEAYAWLVRLASIKYGPATLQAAPPVAPVGS